MSKENKHEAETRNRWRNRIVGHGEEDPEQLMANPRNWRVHPKFQQDALKDVLDAVGFVAGVIINQRSGNMIDGHLRVELAISEGEATVPVEYVDLTDEEERIVLATFDPLGNLAVTDPNKLQEIIEDTTFTGNALQGLIDDLAERSGVVTSVPRRVRPRRG